MADFKQPRYQDLVIKDGELIGDFDGLYENFDDPWHQSRGDHVRDSRRLLTTSWCSRLREDFGSSRVVELGCGFGHLTDELRERGFSATGLDVSQVAIDKARRLHPSSVFLAGNICDFDLIHQLDPDIIVMAEVTWYVLDQLQEFLDKLRTFSDQRTRRTFMIHLLTTYAPGIQKYGADKFTNLEEIKAFFDFTYLESGTIYTPREDDPYSQGTYFVCEIKGAMEAQIH